MPAPPRRSRPPIDDRPARRLARVLNRLGAGTRREMTDAVLAGRVRVNGATVRDPDRIVLPDDSLDLDGLPVRRAERHYMALNKPRGLVTTAHDEKGRPNVVDHFPHPAGARLLPVGRLDMASEGLLLFTNDPAWAAALIQPGRCEKEYHLQIDAHPAEEQLQRWREGISDEGELLDVHSVDVLRAGPRNAWLRVVLTAGRNRHLRRMARASGWDVLRLIRVRIGPILLGALRPGEARPLSAEELDGLPQTPDPEL